MNAIHQPPRAQVQSFTEAADAAERTHCYVDLCAADTDAGAVRFVRRWGRWLESLLRDDDIGQMAADVEEAQTAANEAEQARERLIGWLDEWADTLSTIADDVHCIGDADMDHLTGPKSAEALQKIIDEMRQRLDAEAS